jgi:DNA-binding response OmpR family regulator
MNGQNLRILALEPDQACREHLAQFLSQRTDVDVVMTSTAEEAAGAMHERRPDLVLTSAVLPPRAEEQVMDALKHLDPDGSVPVITVPPLLNGSDETEGARGMFAMLSRRRPAPRPSYDLAALSARIDEALRQVRDESLHPRIRPARVELSTELMLRSAAHVDLARPAVPTLNCAPVPYVLQRKRLDRAPRLMANDLPSRCTLTTPEGFIVRMVNVSQSGVLFESPLKFTRDAETSLSLFSPQATLVLPARIVRSEVATVNGLGVTYQTAAQFGESLDLAKKIAPVEREPILEPLTVPAEIVEAPTCLADLLVRITNELYQHQRGDAARAAFEAGLRQLVPACEIRLCDRLVHRADSGDSIYFAVPGASGVMVQASFDHGHEPTAEDFKLLRAAAAMASVIVHGETHSLLVRRSA